MDMGAPATPIAPARPPEDAAARSALWREPRAQTVLDIVAGPASRYDTLAALVFSDDGHTATRVTWRELWDDSRAQGARLAGTLTSPGEPVLLIVPTSPVFFTAFFGILAAGGVPVPLALPTTLNPARLDWYRELLGGIAADAGARLVLTTRRYVDTLATCLADSVPGIRVMAVDDDPPRAAADWAPATPAPNDLALLQYTSGSTSHPKGVALSHANLIANVEIINGAIVTPTSVGLSWLPLYHDMGLIGGAIAALYGRTPILLMPTTLFIKRPASWLRSIGAFGATITLAPNFAYQHALRHVALEQLDGVSLDSLVTALNGAEPVDLDAVKAFEEKFAGHGLRRGVVQPVYGLAESALAVTFEDPGAQPVDDVDADALEQHGLAVTAHPPARARRFASVGRPLPTQQVRIVNERDEPLPDRTVGEVVVQGPSVMTGYYRNQEATAEALRGGWLHTGDIGYFAEGRLYLTGRKRDLIIRYGRNYYPADIEAAIGQAEGLGRGAAVVFGVGDSTTGQVVVVAETRLRAEADLTALAREIHHRVHAAFLFGPDDIRLVALGAIPRTTSGKVRRDACRRLYLAGALPTPVDRRELALGRPDND
jgi:fatty-acyl-CoA synthase